MSIRAELNVETTARNGQVVRKYTVEIMIDLGHNQGEVQYLTPTEARAFLAELSALVEDIPPEDA